MAPTEQLLPASDSGQVLRKVSEALRALIRGSVPELAAENAVVFDSPAEVDSQGQNLLSLFLYNLRVDLAQSNQPPTLTRQQGASGGTAALRALLPPATLSLDYMMVPYAKSRELELVIADRLVRLFHVTRALPPALLDRALVACGNEEIAIRPMVLTSEAQRNLWMGFPGKAYKLTLPYTLSPVRIPADADRSVDMTIETQVALGEVDH
jgi:hypothetical protein